MDTSELFQDADLETIDGVQATAGAGSVSGAAGSSPPAKQQAADLLQGMEGLSARERNRLKRKAKAMGKQDSLLRDSGQASRGAFKAVI